MILRNYENMLDCSLNYFKAFFTQRSSPYILPVFIWSSSELLQYHLKQYISQSPGETADLAEENYLCHILV